mgnify:CR=1 FL=1
MTGQSSGHTQAHRPNAATLDARLVDALYYFVGKNEVAAQPGDWTLALSKAVRDDLVDRWIATAESHHNRDVKRAYYLSMEYLPGRMLGNALLALDCYRDWQAVLEARGLDIETLHDRQPDPALGNGGLGRLAACLMDSLASHDLPGYAYGIRYDYGMFAQQIHDGWQIEAPDDWLSDGYPWEFSRPEVAYPVRFGGHVEYHGDSPRWYDAERVRAMAYDTLVPGFDTSTVLTLRLWAAKASAEFDLGAFNAGQYGRAVSDKNQSENVNRVLYPDDSTEAGRELRLRQEYFFSSASLQDIIRRYRAGSDNAGRSLEHLADKVAIHLNDTHPAIAVAELMRLLVDEHELAWNTAWRVCTRVFSYTNHTLMPEALEAWPVGLVEHLLPRHLEIILAINAQFLEYVRELFPGDDALAQRVSLIDESGERRVRMAHLAVVASHTVNGVSALHTRLLKNSVFADFARIFPDQLINVTNGVTPRRWLNQANPALAGLLDGVVGSNWRRDLTVLDDLKPYADDADFRSRFEAVKTKNKQQLAAYIKRTQDIDIDPNSLFDVQIKRIHEYKRQLLNVLHVITRYYRIRAEPDRDWGARTVIIAGKAASSYAMAKLIVKLIHDVAKVINNDAMVGNRLKVIFVPDYSVRVAESIVPAADLSEQISTAGTEASGTGNMKLALNGALTIGTEDGANIEIREQVGADNIFIFGNSAEQIETLRAQDYDAESYLAADAELKNAISRLADGTFSPDDPSRYHTLVDTLIHHGDHYKLLADYRSYVDTQDRVDALYHDRKAWLAKAIRNVAGMGTFSADKTAGHYASEIWHIRPVHQPASTTRDDAVEKTA